MRNQTQEQSPDSNSSLKNQTDKQPKSLAATDKISHWQGIANACNVLGGIIIGLGIKSDPDSWVFYILLLCGLGVIAFGMYSAGLHNAVEVSERRRIATESKLLAGIEKGKEERNQRIQKVIDNYTARDAVNRPSDNAGKINMLLASGIAVLETNEEMVEVLNRLEKYVVVWPQTWGFTPKTLFDKLASTGTILKDDPDVGCFIMMHLPPSGKLPSSTPEEKAAQTRRGA